MTFAEFVVYLTFGPPVAVNSAAAAIFVFVILPLMLVRLAVFGDDTDYADEGA